MIPTAQQQAVIDHPLQPMRIAAGAGTGKTTTLAMRMAHMIDNGIAPDEILGLTFTNKAAEELDGRIRSMLDSQLNCDHEVEIQTYHGFAGQLLREFGMLVGIPNNARIITPTFARQLMFDAIGQGEYETLDATWAGLAERPLKLAGDLGDNLRTLDELVAAIPPVLDEIWQQRSELIGILERYQAAKAEVGAVDFSDLILYAARLVSMHSEVAARIRSRYTAVFLDEYQDTNPAQRELLRAVFGSGFPVTAVGDPDQTIYEWRGASPQNFDRFPEHFPTAEGHPAATLSLTVNRRSAVRILQTANRIRRVLEGDPAGDLQPASPAPTGLVSARWFRTARDEAEFIASTVSELHDSGQPWHSMAILFRKNKDMSLVHQALGEHGIPTEVANLGGLLAIPEIGDIHAWLRILADPTDGPALMRILLGGRYRLGFADVHRLSQWVRESNRMDGADRTLLEAIDALGDQASDAIQEFRAAYRSLVQVAQGVSLVELARTILQTTGAWRELEAMPDQIRLSAKLNIYRFLDLSEQWSPLEGRPSLEAFLNYLEIMADGQSEELDTARLSGEDAVVLLTVHRSKGLEWPTVFLPALYHGNFPAQSQLLEDPFTKPHVLPRQLRLDHPYHLDESMTEEDRKNVLRSHHEHQEWRTAYVAVTRAAERLYASGAYWYGTPAPRQNAVKPSALFEIVVDNATEISINDDEGDRPETLRYAGRHSFAPDPLFPDGWDGAIRATLADSEWPAEIAEKQGVMSEYRRQMSQNEQLLLKLPTEVTAPSEEKLTTSVTGLVIYATCPKRFFWSEIDRLPRRPSSAVRRGLETHRLIELHNRGSMSLEDLHPETFDSAPGESEGGRQPFKNFLESRFAKQRPALIEAPFSLLVDGAEIRGRIDAVYTHGPSSWEIVDFKSGRPPTEPSVDVQLEAYAVAANEIAFLPDPPRDLTVTFAYLGGKLVERAQQTDGPWLDRARTRISRLIGRIREEQFEPEPGSHCQHCDFLRFCREGQSFIED